MDHAAHAAATDASFWALLGLFGLGAFHGINPGMGWLFAVALGMQEGRRAAVWRALLPLGLGHALAIAAAIAVALTVGVVIPLEFLRWPVAAVLLVLGVRRLHRHRHQRWAAMRVGMGGLTWWSFLMATAHGAGLMVLPIFLSMSTPVEAAEPMCHATTLAAANPGIAASLLATLVHGAGYLAVTAVAAVVVFEKLGLGLLRKAWLNLDLIWAAALVVTGLVTLLV
jgi:hypothetical protein